MTAPDIEQIKARLRAALPNYRELGFEPNPKNVITDISAEVAKMLEEARSPIEPADAPAHGSPLDYLGELKGALLSLTDAHDRQTDDERHRALRRCLSLANSAHLAILAERARR